jgi:ureidoacrylate peracid hydrolase
MSLDFRTDPAETGLVVIDMQNDFCHPEGGRGKIVGPPGNQYPMEIVPNVIRLIRACTPIMPVWFTKQVYYPEDKGQLQRRIPSHLLRRGPRASLVQRDSWGAEMLDEVGAEILPEHEVIIKHRASAFYNTTFESELRMKGIQVLIVTGTTSSFCVESTVRDAYARDFDLLVPSDAIADSSLEAQEAVLNNVRRFFGLVTTTDELLETLPAPSSTPAGS